VAEPPHSLEMEECGAGSPQSKEGKRMKNAVAEPPHSLETEEGGAGSPQSLEMEEGGPK